LLLLLLFFNIFIRFFIDWSQFLIVYAAYEAKYASSLEHAIIKEFSGDMESALLAILLKPANYHCIRIKKALSGSFAPTVIISSSHLPHPNLALILE
jgi:hypothetical protein